MTQGIVEQQQRAHDAMIDDAARSLAECFTNTFAMLIERRGSQYAEAIEPLDAEAESLEAEDAALEQDALNLEGLLESRARVSQHEADCLTLAGKHGEAEGKREEMEAAKNAPRLMHERRQAIAVRLAAIETEKQNAAGRAFSSFYREAQQIVRVAERGLFIVLLDGIEEAIRKPGRHEFIRPINPNLFANLTADERSEEWASGNQWYGGRR
jgi:chaperone required for assembly of F1-ATPase